MPRATETQRNRVGVGRRSVQRGTCLAVIMAVLPCSLAAQQLLDRIVARVDGYPITLTDLKAAVALGIGNACGAPEALGDRVARRSPTDARGSGAVCAAGTVGYRDCRRGGRHDGPGPVDVWLR